MRLTVRFVQHAPIGWHCDGRGLYLQCVASTDGSTICRSWVYRYVINGRQRYMGLGPAADVSLAEAREKASRARKLRLEGIDPLEARKLRQTAARLDVAKAMTFGQCVEAYLETHEAAWRNAKHRAQWQMTLTEYCQPISSLPVQVIDTDLILRVLTPLWKTRTETARRLRGRIEHVLSWAKGRGLRTGENPARWRGHLDEMLADPGRIAPVQHHAALPYLQIPEFMAELCNRDSLPARALEFAILTAARTGEVTGAQWSEIDLGAKTWTVPASRMKALQEHKVPLCDRASEILRSLDRRSKRVFPLSSWGMLQLLRELRPGVTVHGFRASFMDWAHETTSFPKTAIDMALAHKVGDKVEAAYRRGDLLDKRRRLMAAWGQYCRGISPLVVLHKAS
ncbi:MAG TPA: integrase arm-type DNA-binding domain-containing protein [Methylocella sp.]|nr:integrase arm-type DNA-binding domain-containing protein [Methylocella sp.]